MKSMREMMTLMESVVAIPRIGEGFTGGVVGGVAGAALTKSPGGAMTGAKIGSKIQDFVTGEGEEDDESKEDLDEKSTSEKQARFMAACAHGADYDSCPSDKVSKEFNKADKGTKQLSNAMKEMAPLKSMNMPLTGNAKPGEMEEGKVINMKDYTDWSMRQGEMGNAGRALDPTGDNVERGLEMYKNYIDSFVDPVEAYDLVLRNFDEEGLDADEIDEIASAIEAQYGAQEDDFTDWSMRQGEMGLEEAHVDSCRQTNPAVARKACKMEEETDDAQASGEVDDLEEDLQNGYDDKHFASGNDYFPNGADGPVVKKVGPSGARQGDNPEQKKMQVDEVHKELVYGYRAFLGESKKKVN
jgi:hypothetical protein